MLQSGAVCTLYHQVRPTRGNLLQVLADAGKLSVLAVFVQNADLVVVVMKQLLVLVLQVEEGEFLFQTLLFLLTAQSQDLLVAVRVEIDELKMNGRFKALHRFWLLNELALSQSLHRSHCAMLLQLGRESLRLRGVVLGLLPASLARRVDLGVLNAVELLERVHGENLYDLLDASAL